METIDTEGGRLTATPEARASLRREYKDSVFRLLFNNKETVINLYNAIAGERIHHGNPGELYDHRGCRVQNRKERYRLSA